jgi:LPXTG-motif cell wall-anchored protein
MLRSPFRARGARPTPTRLRRVSIAAWTLALVAVLLPQMPVLAAGDQGHDVTPAGRSAPDTSTATEGHDVPAVETQSTGESEAHDGPNAAALPTAPGTGDIRSTTHEGQQQTINPDGSVTQTTYTSGNVTSYREGDSINFHYTLTFSGTTGTLSGQMAIRYSKEDDTCNFFESDFGLGTWNSSGGAVEPASSGITVTTSGSPTYDAGNEEWVQLLDLSGPAGSQAVINYHLTVNNDVEGCTGSSQHSRLAPSDAPGDYKQTGRENVPVPASQIIYLPDLTVIKYVDRGDGTFVLAGVDEWAFTATSVADPAATRTLNTDAAGQAYFENLAPDGDWTVTESEIGGSDYEFVRGEGTNCTFTGDVATASVLQGTVRNVQDAECIFYNRIKQGSITIVKNAIPDDPQDFAFTGDLGTFSLDDDGDPALPNSQTFPVSPGQYAVTESGVAGWNLTGLSCDDSASPNPSDTDLGTRTATINVEPGESVTCTFTNTKEASIVIVKNTVGGDGTFDFAQNMTPGVLSLTTVGGTASQSYPNQAPGTYTVLEVVPAGWDLTGLSCIGDTDGGNVFNGNEVVIDLDAGENITCTFTNTKRGEILVDKVTDPSGDPQAFTFTGAVSGSITDTDPPLSSGLIVPGTYAVTETVPAGWDLTSATCSDGSDPASIDLAAGETVTCTFTNTKRGQIIVDKVTNPSGDPQAFTFTGPSGIDGEPIADTDPPLESDLIVPGTYTVAEIPVAGWDLTSATCSDGSDPGSIDLAAGETVTCTFTNTKRATITIVKETIPADTDQLFEFDAAYQAANIILPSGGSDTSDPLQPGSYLIEEIVPAGWSLTEISCVGASDWTKDLGQAEVAVTVAAGENAVCTFTNTQLGRILVDKVTDPAGDPQKFTFGGAVSGSIADGDAPLDSGLLSPGTYSVSETVPAGWDLTSATCSDGSPVNAIDLAAGETVTCTFTNTKRGSITIAKETIPDGDPALFDFVGDLTGQIGDGGSFTVGNLQPGSYDVSEVVPADWKLTGLVCSDGSPTDLDTATATIDLAPGESVTCTFTNTKRGTITIVKVADPDDGTDFDFEGDLGDFSLNDPGNPSKQFVNLLPGTYAVTEVDATGSTLTGLVCSDGSPVDLAAGTATIDLAPGESVVCTFSNTEEGSITIVKDASPADDTAFGFTGDLGAFSLSDPSNTTEVTSGLLPGTYDVTETALAGWALTGLVCSDGSPTDLASGTASIDLAAGENVICTFTNTEEGSITIVKDADPADDTAFGFTGDLGAFSLSDPSGTTKVTGGLLPGTYEVTETALAGWALTGLTCSDGSPVDLASGTASIALAAGEDVTCTYTNTEYGSITIVKDVQLLPVDSVADDTVDFRFDGSFGAFLLDDPETDDGDGVESSITFGSLLPGDYDVEELDISLDYDGDGQIDFELGAITCAVGDSTFTIDDPDFIASGLVTIGLAAGDDVVCTFTNEEQVVLPPQVEIGDWVWEDLNKNGRQDPGEPPIAGVTVELYKVEGSDLVLVDTTVTGADGKYTFIIEFEDYGDYVIKVVVPDGYTVTIPGVGDKEGNSSIGADGMTSVIVVDGSQIQDFTWDAGLYKSEDLPKTGADHRQLMLLSGALLAMGMVLMLGTRRRREDEV